jgi:hypothetical protein
LFGKESSKGQIGGSFANDEIFRAIFSIFLIKDDAKQKAKFQWKIPLSQTTIGFRKVTRNPNPISPKHSNFVKMEKPKECFN